MTSRTSTKATGSRPREGLPPCLNVARFEERAATFHDTSCGSDPFAADRFIVSWGTPARWGAEMLNAHADIPPLPVGGHFTKIRTDDPAEAKVAWVRAEHWVRTGELP